MIRQLVADDLAVVLVVFDEKDANGIRLTLLAAEITGLKAGEAAAPNERAEDFGRCETGTTLRRARAALPLQCLHILQAAVVSDRNRNACARRSHRHRNRFIVWRPV